MLVKDYMTRHPIMIEPNKRITEAQKLMTENNVQHLPVVGDGKRLLGMMTRQRLSIPPERLGSLDVWEITRYLSDLTVSKVMLKGLPFRPKPIGIQRAGLPVKLVMANWLPAKVGTITTS